MSEASSPFNPKLVVGLILAGLLTFGALVLLVAFGGQAGAERSGRAHALSVSATGFRALAGLAATQGRVDYARSPEDWGVEELLVVAIEDRTAEEDLQALIRNRQGRATLFILPKWATVADPAHRGWVQAAFPGQGAGPARLIGGVSAATSHAEPVGRSIAGEDVLSGLDFPLPRAAQIVEGKAVVPLAAVDGNRALIARLGDQPHYLVADPDLLNNQGLKEPAAAQRAVALLARLNSTGAAGVRFDLTMNGLGTADGQSLLRTALEPPFLAMTLALVAAALLAGLHGAFRFGPVRRPERAIPFGKTALVENGAGLIRLARREGRLGPAYAEVARHEAAQAVHAPAWLTGQDLDAYLDRVGRQRGLGSAWSDLARDLKEARGRRAMVAAARALAGWRRAVLG